jgi:hypothetical protein
VKRKKAYDFTVHDWAHKFALSKNYTLGVAWAAVRAARGSSLFYRPNISALRARPMANDFY